MSAYKKLLDGLAMVGEAITEISTKEEHQQADLIVVEIVNMLGFDNPDFGDKLAMLRFVVENEDYDLSKLTKQMMNASPQPVSEEV